ncbi:MAG: Heavy metal transport/detoxification protein [Deltaproteobacteria bacterium]|nr:Heavy metal transport/detoxification protein [Deltaproteobacteria bacterium]
MHTRSIGTTMLVVAAVSIVAVLALYVRVGATADKIAVISTGGMTCENCAGTIRKALEREKGVAATEVDVAGGWVVVGFDSKMTRPDILADKVSATGFTAALHSLLSPEQFRQRTGRDIGNDRGASGCCGSKGGGCNASRQKS